MGAVSTSKMLVAPIWILQTFYSASHFNSRMTVERLLHHQEGEPVVRSDHKDLCVFVGDIGRIGPMPACAHPTIFFYVAAHKLRSRS